MQVIETSKRVLGEEHPDTLTSMNNLAFIWKKQRRDTEAIELMKKCDSQLMWYRAVAERLNS